MSEHICLDSGMIFREWIRCTPEEPAQVVILDDMTNPVWLAPTGKPPTKAECCCARTVLDNPEETTNRVNSPYWYRYAMFQPGNGGWEYYQSEAPILMSGAKDNSPRKDTAIGRIGAMDLIRIQPGQISVRVVNPKFSNDDGTPSGRNEFWWWRRRYHYRRGGQG